MWGQAHCSLSTYDPDLRSADLFVYITVFVDGSIHQDLGKLHVDLSSTQSLGKNPTVLHVLLMVALHHFVGHFVMYILVYIFCVV